MTPEPPLYTESTVIRLAALAPFAKTTPTPSDFHGFKISVVGRSVFFHETKPFSEMTDLWSRTQSIHEAFSRCISGHSGNNVSKLIVPIYRFTQIYPIEKDSSPWRILKLAIIGMRTITQAYEKRDDVKPALKDAFLLISEALDGGSQKAHEQALTAVGLNNSEDSNSKLPIPNYLKPLKNLLEIEQKTNQPKIKKISEDLLLSFAIQLESTSKGLFNPENTKNAIECFLQGMSNQAVKPLPSPPTNSATYNQNVSLKNDSTTTPPKDLTEKRESGVSEETSALEGRGSRSLNSRKSPPESPIQDALE